MNLPLNQASRSLARVDMLVLLIGISCGDSTERPTPAQMVLCAGNSTTQQRQLHDAFAA